jgi:YD repeat-containing protein
MVAIVSGETLGLTTSSRNVLGGNGQLGNSTSGRSGEQVFVNSVTGNLILQDRDESLTGVGIRAPLIRTYNSQGLLDDDNGDNWRLGVHQRLHALTGTVNTAGSTITKTFGDGAEVVYTYSASLSRYVSTDGDGAHDSLTFSSGTWTWRDGSARATETYDANGRLNSSADQDGNALSYFYTGNLLIRVTDSSSIAQHTHFDYTGNLLTAVRVESNGVIQTLTRYSYDSLNRLDEVQIDLTPQSNGVGDGNVYTTSYTYDGASRRIASITQTDGTVTSFAYEKIEGSYRVKTVTDAVGNVTTLSYLETTDSVEGGGGAVGETVTNYNVNTGALVPPSGYDTLISGIPVNNVSATNGSMVVYKVEVPAGAKSLSILTSGGTGDGDIFVRRGKPPTLEEYDARDNDSLFNDEFIAVESPEAGTWYFGVYVFENVSGMQIVARVEEAGPAVIPLTAGVAVNDIAGESDHQTIRDFSFQVPPGTTSVRVTLTGDNGDLDMYVRQGNPASYLEHDYKSDGASSNEAITIANPAAGTWYVNLSAWLNTHDASLVVHLNPGANVPPTVEAGQGQSVANGATVNLSGSGTATAGAVSYLWTQLSGPTVTLAGSTTASPSFTAPTVSSSTTLAFRLRVTDANGLTNTDVVRVLVGAPASLPQPTQWTGAAFIEGSSTAASNLLAGSGPYGNTVTVWKQGNTLYSRSYDLVDRTWSAAVAVSGSSTAPVDAKLSVDTDRGNALLTWRDSTTGEILANRYLWDANTSTYSWEGAQVIATVGGSITVSSLGGPVNSDGCGAVVWTETNGATKTLKISRNVGNGWQTVETVATTTGTLDSAQATISVEDAIQVVWRGNNGSNNVINGRTYDGSVWQSTYQIATSATQISHVRLMPDGPSSTALTWVEGTTLKVAYGADTEWEGVTIAVAPATVTEFSSTTHGVVDASAWATSDGRIFFNSSAQEDVQTLATGTSISELRIHGNDQGGFVVTWRDGGNLFAQTYQHEKWQGAQRLESTSGAAGSAYAFLSRDAGNGEGHQAVAVWLQNDGTADSVFFSHYDFATPASIEPKYTVQETDTWATIAQKLYGTTSLAGVVQEHFGSPALKVGLELTDVPTTLKVTNATAASANYTVPAGATWLSITQAIYDTTDANAIAALQAATGSPVLTSGLNLVVPLTLSYVSSAGSSTGVSTEVSVETPLYLTTTLRNDTSGRLTTVRSPAVNNVHFATQFAYDSDGNVTSIAVDPNGLNRVTTFAYDANGNVTLTRDAAGNTVTRTYSSTNQLLTETAYITPDPDGAGSGLPTDALTARYVYDSEDHLRFTISAEGRVTERRYFPNGRLRTAIEYTDAQYDLTGLAPTAAPSEAQLSTWAAARNLATLQRADYTYDFRGNLATETRFALTNNDGTGNNDGASTTTYVYDHRGLLLSTVRPRAGAAGLMSTQYLYDGLGRVVLETRRLASGVDSVTQHVYTDATRIDITNTPPQSMDARIYDHAGRLIVSARFGNSEPPASAITYIYDVDGRLRATGDALGIFTHMLYDEAGRKVASVDGDGTLTQYVYDGAGQLVKAIEYSDRVPQDTLDTLLIPPSIPFESPTPANVPLNSLLSAIGEIPGRDEAEDRISRWVYDAAGRLVYEIDPAGAVTQTITDGAGRVTGTVQYAVLVSIDPNLDALDVSDITLTPAAKDRHTRSLYDGDGNLVGALDAEGYLVEFIYDAAGQLIEQVAYANPTPEIERESGDLSALRPTADAEFDIRTRYFYDGQGRRAGVLDGKGHLSVTGYDIDSNVSAVTRFDDVLVWIPGDTLGTLQDRVATGAVSHTTSYEYDNAGRLISETNYENTETVYEYDFEDRLISTIRAVGTDDARIIRRRYNAFGQVIAELSAVGAALIQGGMNEEEAWGLHAVHHEYDAGLNRISTTDQNGNTTLFYYDRDKRLTHVINAEGEVTETTYDALGRVIGTRIYANEIVTTGLIGGLVGEELTGLLEIAQDNTRDSLTTTTYTFTSFGRETVTTTALGNYTTVRTDAFGDEFERVQPTNGTQPPLVHQYEYDRRGQLTATIWDAMALIHPSEAREYDAFGRLTEVRNQDDQVQTFEYDLLGQLTATVNELGQRRTTSYDAFGRVTSTEDAFNFSTIYDYVDAERKVTVTSPQGVSVTTVHNRHGQNATATDGRLTTTTYAYTKDGQLETVSDVLGTRERHTYDRAGRLVESKDANLVITQFEYDAVNRVRSRIVDTGTLQEPGLRLTTTTQYDNHGRVHEVTDSSGILTRTEYDRDGRVKSVTVDPDGTHRSQTVYDYDVAGNVILMTQGALSSNPYRVKYVYDTLGRRIEEIVDPVGLGGSLNLSTQYRYDANGNVVRKIDAENYSTWYVYDAGDRLRYTIDALGGVTENTYDVENRLQSTRRYASPVTPPELVDRVLESDATAWVLGAGNDPLQPARREQYVYDPLLRRSFIITDVGPYFAYPTEIVELRYDENGNVTQRRMFSKPIGFGTYTTVEQVTAALTSVGNDLSGSYVPADAFEFSVYDIRDRLIFSSNADFGMTRREYDGNGNVIVETRFAQRAAATGSVEDLLAFASSVAGDANNRVTRTWYDASNRPRFVLDAQGYLTETRYDDVGRETKQVTYVNPPVIEATDLLEDVENAAIAATSAEDRMTTTVYDSAGRVYRVYDSYSNYEQYGYDAVGNKTSYQNKLGFVWEYEYDGNHRMTLERSPDVSVFTATDGTSIDISGPLQTPIVTFMEYDALGNVKHRTEAYGTLQARRTSYVYDGLGRQTKTIYPAVGYYNYTVDDEDRTAANVFRDESSVPLFSEVFYDTLGNAVRSIDVAGNTSFRVYDKAGRIAYEVDAKNHVTYHGYNSLGHEIQLVRLALPLTSSLPTDPNSITREAVLARAVGSSGDRTINKTFDKMGRLLSVTEPVVQNFLPSGSGSLQMYEVGKKATFEYNAFGDLVRQTELNTSSVSGLPDATYTTYYYDRVGQKTAEIDTLGYVTKFTYDAAGNVKRKVEYAKATSVWDVNSYTPPDSTIPSTTPDAPLGYGYDRDTAYTYDRLNRLTNERKDGFQYTQFIGSTRFTIDGFHFSEYEYDWVGNIVRTTVNGATSRNYFDALGRLIATAEPARDRGDGQSVTPFTVMKRDAYGNMIEQIRYANNPTSLSLTTFTATSVSAGIAETLSLSSGLVTRTTAGGFEFVNNPDRITRIKYDIFGRAIHTEDGTGADQYASYTKRGEIAKEWQFVTDNDNVVEVLVSIYKYDALGQQIAVIEPQSLSGTPVIVERQTEYNAFGEVTKNKTVGGAEETFEYDNAGRMWRTRGADDIYRVYLYNVAGQATAEIRGNTYHLGVYQNAGQVNQLPLDGVMRTISAYDRLGRLVERREPSFLVGTTTVTPTVHQTLDRWGQALVVQDASGYHTTYRYNQLGQVTETKYDATALVRTTLSTDGHSATKAELVSTPTSYNYYDRNGRLIGTEDGNGNVNRATYNAGGKLIREDHADGTRKLMAYNNFSDLVETLDELDYRVRQGYDKAGRVIQISQEIAQLGLGNFDPLYYYVDPAEEDAVTYHYTYDEAGRRKSETNGALMTNSSTLQETTKYWYDLRGNIVKRTSPMGFATTYQYDVWGLGKKTREENANSIEDVLTWNYNAFGRLEEHRDLGNNLYEYEYDPITGLLSSQTSAWGQNVAYFYNDAGKIELIQDRGQAPTGTVGLASVVRDTVYKYDSAGRLSGEKVTVDGLVHQDTTTTYDSRGFVSTLSDPRYTIAYSYDDVGNRTRIHSTYHDNTGATVTRDYWYAYDKMNRVDISQGALSGSTIVVNTQQGIDLSYDEKGQRASSMTYSRRLWTTYYTYNGGATEYRYLFDYLTEGYAYDGLGRLKTITRDQAIVNLPALGVEERSYPTYVYSRRTYDKASRELTEDYEGDPATIYTPPERRLRESSYDDDGRLLTQSTSKITTSGNVLEFSLSYFGDGVTYGWDDAGVLRGYNITIYNPSGTALYFSRHTFLYRAAETYQEFAHTVEHYKSNPSDTSYQLPATGQVSYGHNVNHEVISFMDTRDPEKNRFFVSNQSGQVLTSVRGNFDGLVGRPTVTQAITTALNNANNGAASSIKSQVYLFSNGMQMGSLENLGAEMVARFDVNYTPVSENYPERVPTQTVVQQGDTLRLIAARIYGDANLWYVIAGENGLSNPDEVLETGAVLRIPNDVISLSNTGTTFKPFDLREAIGDTTPTQPAPPPPRAIRHGCGLLGQIIATVIVIVVAYYTGLYVEGLLQGALEGIWAGGFLAAAGGAAAGGIAGQVVGNFVGVQDGFSWKSVATSAFTAGLLKGVPPVAAFLKNSSALVQGAIRSIVNQGVNVVVGLQDKFDWRDVAISAISAQMAQSTSAAVAAEFGTPGQPLSFGVQTASDLSGIAASGVTRLALGGKVDAVQLAADAFVNIIGNSIVARTHSGRPSSAGSGPAGAAEQDAVFDSGLGDDFETRTYPYDPPVAYKEEGDRYGYLERRLANLRLSDDYGNLGKAHNRSLDHVEGLIGLDKLLLNPGDAEFALLLDIENAVVTDDAENWILRSARLSPAQVAKMDFHSRLYEIGNRILDTATNALDFAEQTRRVATGVDNKWTEPDAYGLLTMMDAADVGRLGIADTLTASLPFGVGAMLGASQMYRIEGEQGLIQKLNDIGVISGRDASARRADLLPQQAETGVGIVMSFLPAKALATAAIVYMGMRPTDAEAGVRISRSVGTRASDAEYTAGRMGEIMLEPRTGVTKFDQGRQIRGLDLEGDIRASRYDGAESLGNFPTIDVFEAAANGKAARIASIKSLDLRAVSYADPRALENVLSRYADRLSDFKEATRKITQNGKPTIISVTPRSIAGATRELVVAIPKTATRDQLAAFRRAADYASKLSPSVKLLTVPYR